jgi:hypothetical protein
MTSRGPAQYGNSRCGVQSPEMRTTLCQARLFGKRRQPTDHNYSRTRQFSRGDPAQIVT